MKLALYLLLPLTLFSQDLKTLIDSAQETNHLVKASALTADAKAKELASQKSAYYPTLDVGAGYTTLNATSAFQPGDTVNVYAQAGIDLFDGFRKSNLVKQKKFELGASQDDLSDYKEQITLDIIKDFYHIKSAEATLIALTEKAKQLEADLHRVKQFKVAQLATQDDIDKLQSAYDSNKYALESQKLTINTLKSYLSLKTGVKIDSLDDSSLRLEDDSAYEVSKSLLSLEKQAKALKAGADATNAAYYPSLRLEDSYAYYEYDRDDNVKAMGIEQVEKQNRLSITANMRLFDGGAIKKQKQAIMIQKKALQEQINYQRKQENIRFKLAKDTIHTTKININSASSAYTAAKSTYKSVKAKFRAGIVDNVAYLDALTQKIQTKALYQTSLNDLEIAKANYYYSAGKNIEEYIK